MSDPVLGKGPRALEGIATLDTNGVSHHLTSGEEAPACFAQLGEFHDDAGSMLLVLLDEATHIATRC